MSAEERGLRVFLAEDNEADVYLVEMALQEHGLRFSLISAIDGEQALFLVNKFQASDCPDIAILDQNLPRVTGEQIMEAIRSQEDCKDIPIVIMSSAENWRDRETVQRLGATFFRKAANLSEFLELGALVRGLCSAKMSKTAHN